MEIDTHLPLEEALNGSPQIEQLVNLFQHDAAVLNSFSISLLKTYSRVSAAYTEVLLANQQLSKHLKLFKNLDLAIDNGSKMIGEVFSHFATHLDELSSHCHLLSSQISDSVLYPLTKLVEADLNEVTMLGEHYAAVNAEHEDVLAKYMKLSKKRDAIDEKVKSAQSKEVYNARKKLHQVSLHYFSSLNLLQHKRASQLLESGLNYLTTQKLFAASCNESFAATGVDDLIQAILTTVKSVTESMSAEAVVSSQKIPILESENDRKCYPEPNVDGVEAVPDLSLTQKSGYLFHRSKSYLISHWTRCFVIVQPPGGHLLIQSPEETAASLLIDLTEGDVHALPADVDDRRWVIEIVAKKSKKQIYFQAENQRERDEWIAVINHIAGSPLPPPSPMSPVQPSTPDFSGHQQHPSLFSQIRRSLVEGGASVKSPGQPPPDDIDPEAAAITLSDAPIQFDMSSPSEEFPPLPSWLGMGGQLSPSTRANPFGEGDTSVEGATKELENASVSDNEPKEPRVSSFAHTYPLRFVGSVRIDPSSHSHASHYDHLTDQLVCDTIQQILAARAIHGIFRMSEVNMLIATDGIYLLDTANSTVKGRYPLHRVVHATAHRENNRLFAFVSSSVDSPNDLTCHVFECNVPAQSIIETLHMVEQMTTEIGAAAVMSSIAEMEKHQQQVRPQESPKKQPEQVEDKTSDNNNQN